MKNRMIKKLKSMLRGSPDFDPATLNDPRALQVEWTPSNQGGASFKTHTLVQHHSGRITFLPSKGMMLFSGVFSLIGLGAMVVGGVIAYNADPADREWAMIIPAIFGFIFFVVGIALYFFSSAPAVFDRDQKAFWKGRKEPSLVFDPSRLKTYVPLNEIIALQLIRKVVSGNKSSYNSYELNLVLKDNRRVNVIDHGAAKAIREDAATLARFLQLPLWDGSGDRE